MTVSGWRKGETRKLSDRVYQSDISVLVANKHKAWLGRARSCQAPGIRRTQRIALGCGPHRIGISIRRAEGTRRDRVDLPGASPVLDCLPVNHPTVTSPRSAHTDQLELKGALTFGGKQSQAIGNISPVSHTTTKTSAHIEVRTNRHSVSSINPRKCALNHWANVPVNTACKPCSNTS